LNKLSFSGVVFFPVSFLGGFRDSDHDLKAEA
jgi:hypothetical protein